MEEKPNTLPEVAPVVSPAEAATPSPLAGLAAQARLLADASSFKKTEVVAFMKAFVAAYDGMDPSELAIHQAQATRLAEHLENELTELAKSYGQMKEDHADLMRTVDELQDTVGQADISIAALKEGVAERDTIIAGLQIDLDGAHEPQAGGPSVPIGEALALAAKASPVQVEIKHNRSIFLPSEANRYYNHPEATALAMAILHTVAIAKAGS
jgi:predicted house-cleaning noncanonical NTP pyrophosphatase (MazG superfamily)